MKKWLIISSLFILAGCYSEDVYPLNPIESYVAEVDLSQLEYAYSLEQVAIETSYGAHENTSIADLIDDVKYINHVYGEVEMFANEEDLLVYLEKQLSKYDKRIGIIFDSKSAPAFAIESHYKKLMNTHDNISATLLWYTYGIEKTPKGYFIDLYNEFTTNNIELVTINKEMDNIMANLKLDGLSDLDKLKIIYQYVMDQMTYVDGGLLMHHSPMGFIKGEGVCQAYAVSLQMLLERAGFESRYIIGEIHENLLNEGESGAHAWNMVKLDGNWYHLDATWDDEEPQWKYFLLSDTGMSFSRSWETNYYDIAEMTYIN